MDQKENGNNMSSLRHLKLAQKAAAQHQQVVRELNAMVLDIDRCEKTITALRADLDAANSKYPAQRNTREDIAYLSDLLECAKKKLAWEKQMASLQKRTPILLEKMNRLFNDSEHPPSQELRGEMLRSLQSAQASLERLKGPRVE